MSRNEIVTDSDLVSAVEDALRKRGVIDKLKAKIRAEVFHVLDDKDATPIRTHRDPPQDLFIAMELVKEFLMMMKLDNTLSVFCEEMSQSVNMTVDRSFIGSELGVNTAGSDESIPMLVLMTQFMKRNREELVKNFQLHQQLKQDEELRQRLILQQGLQQPQPIIQQHSSQPPQRQPSTTHDRSDLSTAVSSITSQQLQQQREQPISAPSIVPAMSSTAGGPSRGGSSNHSLSEGEGSFTNERSHGVFTRIETVRDSLVVEPEYSYSFYNDSQI
jgi:hypothetical protein